MARCKHERGNIQQFTEVCLDCGRNIYESDEQYEESLKREISSLKKEIANNRISELEDEKEALLEKLGRGKKKDLYEY